MLDSRASVRGSITVLLVVLSSAPRPVAAADPSAASLERLRQYLRIDSSTAAGTLEAAAFLRDTLHREGIATRWIVSPAGLPFVLARAGAADSRGALLLLHHLDVVPPGDSWRHPPFAAEIADGILHGRGAIDDKSLGIAHLTAFLRWARQPPAAGRELILLAVSGEEAGGEEGLGWLLEAHPELFEHIEAVLTEGGSNRVYGGRVAWWGVEVAQKRPLWLTAKATGRAGHGSSLNLHSAPHRLIRGLARLVDRPRRYRLTDEARQFLQAAAPLESRAFRDMVAELDRIVEEASPEAHLLPGIPNYLLDTLQVNSLAAGERINVVPGEASAKIDVRLLPDTDEERFLAELRDLVGDEVELEVVLSAPRVSPSPTHHPFYRCMEQELGGRAPVVPTMINAITDARFLRARGIAAYGFSPFALEAADLRGIHAVDEQIPLDVFADGVDAMWRVVLRCAGI